ncbi:hypothetical protein SDC9_187506 [bioreactor metagenome]|uniref:Uncharacterized protein n=1 Tax=bioreactor metagenome TaxID=1076179 RepID=A0A645HLR6_9ZZZZ
MAQRAGLTGHAAAVKTRENIELIGRRTHRERLADKAAHRFGGEIFFPVLAVDRDFPGAGSHLDTSHRAFPTSGGQNFIVVVNHDSDPYLTVILRGF